MVSWFCSVLVGPVSGGSGPPSRTLLVRRFRTSHWNRGPVCAATAALITITMRRSGRLGSFSAAGSQLMMMMMMEGGEAGPEEEEELLLLR